MKKFLSCLIAVSLLATPALAKPMHHGGGGHHKPAPVVIHHPKHHSDAPLLAAAGGLLGFVIGSTIASTSQPIYNTYTVSNDQQCFLVVSKSSGNVIQKCVSGDNQVLYVD